MLKNGGKYLGIIILSLTMLFFLTACDSGSSGVVSESETYSSSLKIGYLEEDELSALSLSVDGEIYTDLEENYQNGFLNLDLVDLEEKVDVIVLHPDLNFTEEEFTIDQKNADKNMGIYTTHVIVDETTGERFTLPETEAEFVQEGHKYIFYPGKYVFGRDFMIYEDDVTVEAQTGFKETSFEFKEGKNLKIGADNISFKGISITTIQTEAGVGEAIQVNNGCKNISIENSDLEGILMHNGVSGITIKNNKIHDGLYMGIHIGDNSSNILIEANEIYDNSWYWADNEGVGYEGIYVDQGSKEITIKDNIIRDNYARAISLVGSTATIVNNTLQNNEFEGILFWSGSDAVVENNLIEDNNLYAIDMRENSQAEIKNNEIKNNNYGIFIKGDNTVDNTVINNNIIENENISLFTRKEDPDNPGESIPTNKILNAENNWWGNSQLNENNLDVKNKDGKLIIRGRVDFKPYAEEAI